MSDLTDLQKYLEKKEEEDRAFQRDLVDQLRPKQKTAMQQEMENRRLISDGTRQEAERRAAERESGDAA